MSQWISVDDKHKPENRSEVLVAWSTYRGHSEIAVAHFNQGSFMNSRGYYIHNPTHWMPLPEPPEGE